MTLTTGAGYDGPLITSPSNDRLKWVRSLFRTTTRKKEGLFVAEGVRVVADGIASGATPDVVLVAPELIQRTERGLELLAALEPFPRWAISESALKSVTETMTTQGVLAVFPIPKRPQPVVFGPILLVLDQVRDPGNAGTILRSADACGVVQTVAFIDSVDAYSPKVVRAGMGAHFRLQILEDVRWTSLLPRLAERPRWLASVENGESYNQVNWLSDSVLIVGGEAEGAGPEADAAASGRVTIPMASSTESLNAAMAATVLLFEAARQRRNGEVNKS